MGWNGLCNCYLERCYSSDWSGENGTKHSARGSDPNKGLS